MSRCSPEWLSAAALSRRRRSGSGERPHGVEKSPHPLCFVACLVTSNNRLALKSPGRGLETFSPLSSITRSQIFRFDAQLSAAVTERAWTDAAPSAVIDAETVGNVSQLILATANCQRGSEERGKKRWHLGGKRGGMSGKQCLLNVLAEVG